MGKWRNYGYLLSLLPGLLAVYGNIAGGYYSLTSVLFSLLFLGGLEWLIGSDRGNQHTAPRDPFPELIIFLLALVHTAVWISLAAGIYYGRLQDNWIWCAALSSGVAAGAGGIVPAHELIHKADGFKQWVGKYMLISCGNFYFFIHHLRIHHRWVGTGHDAATARLNESLYAFFIRTISGQVKEAWQSESDRLRKKGKSAWHADNQILRNLIWLSLILLAVFALLSWQGLLACAIYMTMANLLLEYVNYIEHYGLTRQVNERVNETHSWNSDALISRYLLVDLSRHADHHHYASKPYHTLDTYEHAPTLPGGYAGLIIPALLPPLWRAIVHPQLHKWEKKVKS